MSHKALRRGSCWLPQALRLPLGFSPPAVTLQMEPACALDLVQHPRYTHSVSHAPTDARHTQMRLVSVTVLCLTQWVQNTSPHGPHRVPHALQAPAAVGRGTSVRVKASLAAALRLCLRGPSQSRCEGKTPSGEAARRELRPWAGAGFSFPRACRPAPCCPNTPRPRARGRPGLSAAARMAVRCSQRFLEFFKNERNPLITVSRCFAGFWTRFLWHE